MYAVAILFAIALRTKSKQHASRIKIDIRSTMENLANTDYCSTTTILNDFMCVRTDSGQQDMQCRNEI